MDHFDLATVSLHESAGDGETYAVPAFMGREQRLEHSAGDATRDARTGVGHDKLAKRAERAGRELRHGPPPAFEPVQRVPDEDVHEVLERLGTHFHPE